MGNNPIPPHNRNIVDLVLINVLTNVTLCVLTHYLKECRCVIFGIFIKIVIFLGGLNPGENQLNSKIFSGAYYVELLGAITIAIILVIRLIKHYFLQ